jgi:hypothetical protein
MPSTSTVIGGAVDGADRGRGLGALAGVEVRHDQS